MKIGIVCYPTFGGSGVLATELGKALACEGHEVHFITYQQPVRLNVFSENIFYHEVHVPSYPLFDFPPYEIALTSMITDVIINHKLDLLHVHYAIPHASAAYMAKQIVKAKTGKSIPFITTLHGTDITLVGRDKMYEPVVTFSLNKSDAITAVSENLKTETYKNFPINKDIEVIPNFVDVQRFDKLGAAHLRKLIAPAGEKILLHASNFRPVKRVADVIRIFATIRKVLPAKLLMVGDGPERSEAEELTRALQLCNDVRFAGKQEQIEEMLSIGDIFLLPSEYESFGLAALEAMAARTAIISSNSGGLPEVNIHNVTGYLADVGDVQTMSDFSISLLQDETTLATMKTNAYKRACAFEVSQIIPMYEKLYSRFCNMNTC